MMHRSRRPSLRRLGQVAAKLGELGPEGWWLLLQAQLHILRAHLTVRRRPRGELLRDLATPDPSVDDASPSDRERVEAVGLAIDRVARFGVSRPLCLVRSLALQRLLVKRGIPGSGIRIGVRLHEERLQAHAWVQWAGEVVGEDPAYVERFHPFSDLDPARAGVSWSPPAPRS